MAHLIDRHAPMAHRVGRPVTAAGGRRADIEGLRAIAVLLVVFFHASIVGFTGGFVGVDVFFVISGFLITGLMLREIGETGTLSLPSFYARRARRILPAAAVVLLVTVAVSVVLLPPLLVPGAATDAAAAALFVSNVGFAAQATDYFAASQTPSPILHFWSLGVEEQFYLLWPVIVFVVARGALRPGRRVGAIVAAIAVVSFVLALWLTSVNQPWAFFSLPTRAWELGLGALLAVAGTRFERIPGPAAAVAGWTGIALIAIAAVAIGEATPFPGMAALLPTVGAALVIVAGSRATRFGPARCLGTAIPRFFGRISYSLYLWHWPVLVIPVIALGVPLPLWERLVLIGISIALAAATQRWVEEPIRRGRVVGTIPRRNLAMAGGLTVAVVMLSVTVGVSAAAGLHGQGRPIGAAEAAQQLDAVLGPVASDTAGASPAGTAIPSGTAAPSMAPRAGAPTDPGRAGTTTAGKPTAGTLSADASPDGAPASPASAGSTASTGLPVAPTRQTPDGPVPADLSPALADARGDLPGAYLDRCHVQQDGGRPRGSCIYGDPNGTTRIVLFGDSHALAWFPAMEALATDRGWRLLDLTMSACSPADIPAWNPTLKSVVTACAEWRTWALDRLAQEHPDIVVVAGTRGFATVDAHGTVLAGDARTAAWEAGMARTLDRLRASAGHVILLADTPRSAVDPPVCLSAHPTSTLACATPVDDALDPGWLAAERGAAAADGAGFIDPTPWVCPTSPCPAVIGDLLVYRDGGHMTATFAAALSGRLERAILKEVADRPTATPAP